MTQADTALFQASSYLDIGQPARALDVLGEALKADPGNPALLANLAWAHLKAGDDAAATDAAVAAQTAAGKPVATAMIVLINVAHHRHDHREVCEIARAFVAQWPEAYNGHVWYALGLTHLVTSDADRVLVRQAMATALELGQRSPELLLNAAWIESRFADREACLALVDEGLASDPSNADLLKLRAWAVKDSRYSAKVMMGILAIDPMDTEASRSLESQVEPRRVRLLRLVLLAPFLLALAVLLPPVTPRAVAIGLVLAFLTLRAVAPARFLRDLPASYVRSRWRGQERGLVAAVVLSLVGAGLFAVDLPVVGPLVMAAGVVAWGRAVLGAVRHEAREKADGTDTQALVLEAHATRMRGLAAQAGIVGVLSLIFGMTYLQQVRAGGPAAPLLTVTLLAAVVMLACLTVLCWIGLRRSATTTVVSALVFGLLGVGLAGTATYGVVGATTGDAAGRYKELPPSDRICTRYGCKRIRPEITFPTPRPVPDIDIPTFTFEPPDLSELDDLTE